MKEILLTPRFCLTLLFFSLFLNLRAQEVKPDFKNLLEKEVIVIKHDGVRFTGKLLEYSPHELLVEDKRLGPVYIPLHEVRDILDFEGRKGKDYNLFSSRYFITTNGLGLGKGDKYGILHLYGPEAHMAVADDFTLGVMTTWGAIPLIGSAKYAFHPAKNVHISLGVLAGTLGWAGLGNAGILGYGSLTLGNYDSNITLSGGYAAVNSIDEYETGGSTPLLSVACLLRLTDNVHFVGDSFISLGAEGFGVIMPGLRFDRPMKRSAFQFGIGGVVVDGMSFPLPMCSWFYEL